MKNIILIGPPGSGKGTQARKISKKFNLPVFSTGDILREEVKKKTEFGKKAEKIMAAGKFVKDKLVCQIIFSRLNQSGAGFILDGFPRNIKQAKRLIKFFKKKDWPGLLFELQLSDKIAVERISGRRICSQCGKIYHIKYNPPKVEGVCDVCQGKLTTRKDEKKEVVKERLKIYHNQTKPVIEFLKNQKKIKIVYYAIDASKSIDEIYQNILSEI